MIIDIFLPLSLVFIMFTLGLGLTTDDFIKVVREPKALGVGILNQMVLLPIIAFSIVSLMGLMKICGNLPGLYFSLAGYF